MAEMTPHPTDLLEAYSLQILTPETAADVRAHLGACAVCQERLRAVEDAVSLLAYAAPAAAAPAGAEERFMARVAAMRANGHAPAPLTPGMAPSSARTARRPVRRRTLWLTAASLVAAILLLVAFWPRGTVTTPPSPQAQAEQQARALLGAPSATVIYLRATSHGPSNALAVMAMDPASKRGALVTRNLPALTAGHTYEFWLVHTPAGSATVAITPRGTFDVARDGTGSLRFTAPDDLGALADAGVSVEPAGGVATPDAPMLLTLANH